MAHAGLGVGRPGGAPDRSTLTTARRLGPDRVELDVCTTADARLVLRHDLHTANGVPLSLLRWTTLRDIEPALLTLDQGVEQLGDMPLLLDVKSVAVATLLARWLRRRRDWRRFAVCTENRAGLLALRDGAPRVERWRSFPDIGVRRRDHVARVVGALLDHRRPGHLGYVARELGAVSREMLTQRPVGLARAGGVPWRRLLPLRLGALCREVAAAGISTHHWLLTPHLVEAAAALHIPVAVWTVNDAAALHHIAACGGADMVTTDDLAGMRIAWGMLAATAGASPRPAFA